MIILQTINQNLHITNYKSRFTDYKSLIYKSQITNLNPFQTFFMEILIELQTKKSL